MTIAVTGHPAWRRSTSAAARIPGLCDAGRHDPRYRPQGRAAVRRALRGPRRQDHAPERVLGQRHDDAPARAPATAGERPRARHDGSDGFGCPGEATVQAELIARYRILHCQPAFEVTAIARRTSARGDRSRRMSRTTSGGAQRNVQLSRAPPRVPSSLRQVLCACWARYKLHPPGGAVRARDDCERPSTRELPVVCDPPGRASCSSTAPHQALARLCELLAGER
jgi:hypothetical protein